MDHDAFLDAVRDAVDTELSRLGSSKSLYADTGGEMDPETVLEAAADAEHHAAVTYETWAESESFDRAVEAWATTAAEECDHYDAVVAELDAHDPGDDVPAIQRYLRDRTDTVERAGAFVGRTLAADESKSQLTGFFTGRADPQTAGLFRDLRGDLDGQLDRGLDLLDAVCEDEADWDRARDAATAAVRAAYDEYVDRLETMGVNPKPVC